ncbi:MAG TPA: nucleoside hydrolase, partial [Gaiellaceae bacterium]|nr:nucleoside hydrolase [Gaiellaceae bacterium]
LRVLELVGREDVPVAAGADRPLARDLFIAAYVHGESGLDGPALPEPRTEPVGQHAVDFLAERILGSARPVTLVAVGPLTNVALLLARHPEAAGNVERIVLMGGAIAEGNVTPAAEFNVYVDPEAAWRVFRSGLPVTMIGLDVTHKALMLPPHVERLRSSGVVGRFVAELHDFFVEYHRRTYGTEGAPIHDAVAVAQVLRPGIVETVHRHVDVDCESRLCRGRTVVDLWRRTGEEPNADVGVDIDGEAFLELLCARMEGLEAT